MIMEDMRNFVFIGHVDHGKSTVIGRLLYDTNSVPESRLEAIRRYCETHSRPLEYAFILDALKDERSQGITIESARVFLKTGNDICSIIDAPGHIEFLRNMITGASRADLAFVVIDSVDGIQENTLRHTYLLSILGITKYVVLINKMDLVSYSEWVFYHIRDQYLELMKGHHTVPLYFIPVSGMMGTNIASKARETPWYEGPTVLDVITKEKQEYADNDSPFRMYVQDVYKFTRFGDNRRIIAGTTISGTLNIGDEVIFFPSGKKSYIKSFEYFNGPVPERISAGQAVGFTIREQIYTGRGELVFRSDEAPPRVSRRIKVTLFWLSNDPMEKGNDYLILIGTSKVYGRIEEIHKIMDSSSFAEKEKSSIDRYEMADCTLMLRNHASFDCADMVLETSRFVFIDNGVISGGGIIRESLSESTKIIHDHVMVRNYKWEKGSVSMLSRANRYSQRPSLILLTGARDTDKKTFAKSLEERLFHEGRLVYYLGIGNVKYGVDADLLNIEEQDLQEHIRRLAEIAHIMLDAGLILIVTATDLTQEHLEIIKMTVQPDIVECIWMGDDITTDIQADLHINMDEIANQDMIERILHWLQDKGAIFKIW